MKSSDIEKYQPQKKESEQELIELLIENKKLNELMKSYITVQMDQNITKKMTLEKELTDIKKVSLEIQKKMILILKKQESVLDQNNNQLQKTLENGTIDLKENTNKVLMEMQLIENKLENGIKNLNSQNQKSLNTIEQRTSTLVVSTRKSALITHWIDAFKYGFATAVILVPTIIVLVQFNIIWFKN